MQLSARTPLPLPFFFFLRSFFRRRAFCEQGRTLTTGSAHDVSPPPLLFFFFPPPSDSGRAVQAALSRPARGSDPPFFFAPALARWCYDGSEEALLCRVYSRRSSSLSFSPETSTRGSAEVGAEILRRRRSAGPRRCPSLLPLFPFSHDLPPGAACSDEKRTLVERPFSPPLFFFWSFPSSVDRVLAKMGGHGADRGAFLSPLSSFLHSRMTVGTKSTGFATSRFLPSPFLFPPPWRVQGVAAGGATVADETRRRRRGDSPFSSRPSPDAGSKRFFFFLFTYRFSFFPWELFFYAFGSGRAYAARHRRPQAFLFFS